MDFENKYPYTDFHELNLDWILKQMKALAAAWDAYQEQLTGPNGEWPTFKNYIETAWATYQENLTGTNGEWPTFKAAMEQAWNDYQENLTGTNGEWPTFKATMESEWQQFFDNYLQTLGVVQTTGSSITDVMSQQASNKYFAPLGNYDALNKNLLIRSTYKIGYYYNQTELLDDNYIYFIVPVVSGVTYYSNIQWRFLCKIDSQISQYGTTYTADFTGNVYVTYNKNDDNAIFTSETSFDGIAGIFNIISGKLQQTTGNNKVYTMSQKAITDSVYNAKHEAFKKVDDMFETGLNKCNDKTLVGGYILGDGSIAQSDSYKTTDFINVSNFENAYAINKPFRKFMAYDENENAIVSSYINVESQPTVVTLNSNYKYIRVTFYSNNLTNLMISDTNVLVAYEPYTLYAKDGADYGNENTKSSIYKYICDTTQHLGKNKLNPNTLVDGYLESNGVVFPNASYKTTDFIDVSDFEHGYAINVPFRKFLAYDQYKNYIAASYIGTDSAAGVVALNSDYKYVRITLYVSNMTDPQLADSATQTDYEPYDLKIIDGVNYLNTETERAVQDLIPTVEHNMLYGKKWYACGDSFTRGDFTGLVDGYTFTDEPYKNEMKVYPFFIGRRTGMDVVNMAVGGMTMAKVEGRNNDFCTSVYQTIGADADYITLKFGINDGHQSVPIGTINDATDTTFYGAWNKVLTWLITNRPTAKIGIIVSNGLDDNSYAVATIAIANKYGLPYLNEWSGEQVPVLIRSGRTDVDAAIKTIRNETFRVTISNTHPNVICHEYESAFVETWLKTL